ncbi:MAG: NADH-quinone oxidoreductase subunit L [Bacteroidales bacterium]|nr:NADH-quinone oxidoreductase subunit L [Bacteroidales bacterium]
MNQAIQIIILPVLIGILLFLLPSALRMIKAIIAIGVILFTGYLAISLFGAEDLVFSMDYWACADKYCSFSLDGLSRLIILFMSLLSLLVVIYSTKYQTAAAMRNYYAWFLITLGFSYGAVLANNLLLFLICWGILGISLYRLIHGKDEKSSAAAKKTLVIIGASDGIMILGIAIIWRVTGTLNMDEIALPTSDLVRTVACLSLLIGSFAKAGAFPFHTWIPDYAETAPATSSAYLPASLDKLLGIYFLARITTQLFVIGDWIRFILLTIGVITIITSVMMALVQHNYKRLLGYHAVSQVGYMVLGFGLGSMLGIAAGLFHMINHAIYKEGLFLAAGAVEQQSGKEELEDLGGLSRAMPLTFFATLVFALSISGIPPLNGFASKWMIYQGIIDFGHGTGISNQLWMIWLGLAVLGSALTLASFIKFTGGIFLGRQQKEPSKIREVSPVMWIPMLILALVCIGFGVFASNQVVPKLFMPVSGTFEYTGIWASSTVGLLVLVSIALGIVMYLLGNIKNFRTSDSFVGGEKIQDETSFSTLEFYKSMQEFKWLDVMYRRAKDRWFDLYDLSRQFISWLGGIFSRLHTGVLHDYTLWVFAGVVILLLLLIT